MSVAPVDQYSLIEYISTHNTFTDDHNYTGASLYHLSIASFPGFIFFLSIEQNKLTSKFECEIIDHAVHC